MLHDKVENILIYEVSDKANIAQGQALVNGIY